MIGGLLAFPLPLYQISPFCPNLNHIYMPEATKKCNHWLIFLFKEQWKNRASMLFFSPLIGIKRRCKIWQQCLAISCVNKCPFSPSRGLERCQNTGVSGYASWPWIGKNLSTWGKGCVRRLTQGSICNRGFGFWALQSSIMSGLFCSLTAHYKAWHLTLRTLD